MTAMQKQMEEFIGFIKTELSQVAKQPRENLSRHAIVRMAPPKVIRVHKYREPGPRSYPQIQYLPQTRALAPAAPDAYSLCMAQVACPQCRGTGFRPHTMRLYGVEARVAVPCDCVEGERTARAPESASIPRTSEHCYFENFETGLYESEPQAAAWNRSLELAKLVVEAFARDFPAGSDAGLLLMGPCAVGKTHLAVPALNHPLPPGHPSLLYHYP